MIDVWARLSESILASLLLLAGGVVLGGGVVSLGGIAVGCSRAVGYWIHPILRFIGPLLATAWLPLKTDFMPARSAPAVHSVKICLEQRPEWR